MQRAETSIEKSASSSETVLQTLITKGWCFRDNAEMISLIQSKIPPSATRSSCSFLVDSIESELLDMDLRNFGGKAFHDTSSNKKSSYFHGPKILQIVSLRDIQRSIMDSSFRTAQHHRDHLLRFVLTDGLSEIVAIEYTPFPSITTDIIPGCKIRLEGKVTIHYGILCLTAKDLTILGGHVQSLYEEWEIGQKYSGLHSFTRLPQGDDARGPPPFEKLQTGDMKVVVQLNSSHVGDDQRHEKVRSDQHPQAPEKEKMVESLKLMSSEIKTEKPSDIKARPKEVVDALPVQNQAAAQKLLQKMHKSHDERNSRGHKPRFKGKQQESQVFTLDEWERRKASTSMASRIGDLQDISGDEELAWQLQAQLDIENCQEHQVNAGYAAEQIRMSMFNFSRSEERMTEGRFHLRGRGRGRGRGKKQYN
ncbi:hypothetical protein HPP92_008698 [Vanilla planifolia]|uniref:RecQ mediated genome instability protein 1 OB-fold domain-containing protein n=1 Tax=Vanilla planifolia TaxID=51239 RepID=A0A835R9A6_VANPL|nr:hypothetical protein HPP92_008698 [Vanilla planifolia]